MTESHRVLILEDNPADAELILFELQNAGLTFSAKVVETEEYFIRELQDFTYHLILSDYDLPQYNGASALNEAKKRQPDTPFILVTGAVSEDRAIEILTQGAKDYVLKTRLEQRLVPAVQRVLAEAAEHRARKQTEVELREAHRTLEERVKIRTAELQREIEARKKIEETLRESEEKYRVLFEGSIHGILGADIETKRFVFANPSICQMLGYSENELVHLSIADIHPRELLDDVIKEFNFLIQGKKIMSSELPCLRKDGSIVYADIAGSVIEIQGRRCAVGFFARTR